MNRNEFLSLAAISLLGVNHKAMAAHIIQPKLLYFTDDGSIPNSRYPLIVYRNAFNERDKTGARWLEDTFAANNWANSWRNGVFSYHHYHSISHEVLGIYSGAALLHLGGEKGQKVNVQAGDIIVIPAGVGHKNLGDKDGFGVVGAYPDGRNYDIKRGDPDDRPQVIQNIAAVPFPSHDPLQGKEQGLRILWK
jgi:uncharacterized protein YjlB